MAESPAGFSSYAKIAQRHPNEAVGEGSQAGKEQPLCNGRFFDVTEYWVSDDEPAECVPTGQALNVTTLSKNRYSENSLVLRRIVKEQRPPRLQLEIHSSSLQQIFKKITSDLATVNVHAEPIILPAPYHELYHFRFELEAERRAATTEHLQRELQLFRDFEDENLSRTLNLKEIADLKKQGTMRFEYLWSLYKPHELILMQTQTAGTSSILFCAVFQKYWVDMQDGLWFVQVRYMSFDGRRFGPVEKTFEFAIFPGVVNIDSLPAYPLSYCRNETAVRVALEKRSRHFIQLCEHGRDGPASPGSRLHDYQGPVWIQRKKYAYEGTSFFDTPEEMIRGRVLVDPAGFINEHPMFREEIVSKTMFHTLNDETPSTCIEGLNLDIDDLTDDQMICFPATIAGYSLATKHIGFFHVDGFEEVKWEEEEATRLFHSSSKMKVIHDLISGFSYNSQSFGYSISGKGKGLVLLFFGPSGTGKTLTAECVAEYLHQPLYRVSGADLGSDSYDIEKNLQAAFTRSARWRAILLLDEADAFMAERSDDSLERNTLVSILLRLLEYQSGIIILTTNRERHFDNAFRSRMHVTLCFASLTQKEREVVWRSQVGKATPTLLTNADFEALSRLKLDGRSIKNVFYLAGLYSRSRAGPSRHISLADLKAVLQISLENTSGELKKELEVFCASEALLEH